MIECVHHVAAEKHKAAKWPGQGNRVGDVKPAGPTSKKNDIVLQ